MTTQDSAMKDVVDSDGDDFGLEMSRCATQHTVPAPSPDEAEKSGGVEQLSAR